MKINLDKTKKKEVKTELEKKMDENPIDFTQRLKEIVDGGMFYDVSKSVPVPAGLFVDISAFIQDTNLKSMREKIISLPQVQDGKVVGYKDVACVEKTAETIISDSLLKEIAELACKHYDDGFFCPNTKKNE